jgi:hypothetical protein
MSGNRRAAVQPGKMTIENIFADGFCEKKIMIDILILHNVFGEMLFVLSGFVCSKKQGKRLGEDKSPKTISIQSGFKLKRKTFCHF